MEVLDALLRDLDRSSVWLELGVLAACIALAFAISRQIGHNQPPDSVWIGRRTIDGLLFPLLALVLVYAARAAVTHYQPVFVLRVAVPVLVSLALIRFIARVLTAAFPKSGLVRLVERLVSWLAWAMAVLWILGLLPVVRGELEAIHLTLGKSSVSLRTLIEGSLTSGLVLVATLWLSSTFERRVLDEAVTDLSTRKVAVNVTRAVLVFVGMLFALSAVGVDLTALSVLGGAMGVGLGFGLQKLASYTRTRWSPNVSARYWGVHFPVAGQHFIRAQRKPFRDQIDIHFCRIFRRADGKNQYIIHRINGRDANQEHQHIQKYRYRRISFSDSVFCFACFHVNLLLPKSVFSLP